jgi:hypothetical protein
VLLCSVYRAVCYNFRIQVRAHCNIVTRSSCLALLFPSSNIKYSKDNKSSNGTAAMEEEDSENNVGSNASDENDREDSTAGLGLPRTVVVSQHKAKPRSDSKQEQETKSTPAQQQSGDSSLGSSRPMKSSPFLNKSRDREAVNVNAKRRDKEVKLSDLILAKYDAQRKKQVQLL